MSDSLTTQSETHTELEGSKRTYQNPRLQELGLMSELTQTHPSTFNTNDGSGAYTS